MLIYLLNYIGKTYARRARGFLLTYYATWETPKKPEIFIYFNEKFCKQTVWYQLWNPVDWHQYSWPACHNAYSWNEKLS